MQQIAVTAATENIDLVINYIQELSIKGDVVAHYPLIISEEKYLKLSEKEKENIRIIQCEKIEISDDLYVLIKDNFIPDHVMEEINYAYDNNVSVKIIKI